MPTPHPKIQFYNSINAFNSATGASATPQYNPKKNNTNGRPPVERDWEYRVPGYGWPDSGSGNGGWLLVTGCSPTGNDAWLYAYEIDGDDRKTGRVAHFLFDWSISYDEKIFPKFKNQNRTAIMSLDDVADLVDRNYP